jgi:L-ascorbate metabolism protein UlaG (beta-lactamase superfamily)
MEKGGYLNEILKSVTWVKIHANYFKRESSVGKDTLECENEVTYIANAGVLLKLNDKKILIDAFSKKVGTFMCTSTAIREDMIHGGPPFEGIDLMLITHEHEDHFDEENVGRFMQSHPQTVVVSNSKVISRIKYCVQNQMYSRLIELNPKLHQSESILVNDISIEAIFLSHDGKEYGDVQNLAYLIRHGKTILHLGDAAPVKEAYNSLKFKHVGIDLLIANFPYINRYVGRKIIMDEIKPKKLAIVHLPEEEMDIYGWINASKKSYERIAIEFIPTEFLQETGKTLLI